MRPFALLKKSGKTAAFTGKTELVGVPAPARAIMERFAVEKAHSEEIDSIHAASPIPEKIRREVSASGNEESFAIRKEGTRISVYGEGERGILYGLMSFLRLLDEKGQFGYELVYDTPVSAFRGVKLMMPGRSEIGHFKDFVDCMLYFRHNTVMLEIGGAMEYKRHPEINEGWEEYAAFMSEYSGKSKLLQEYTFPWRKNSIHSNNGAGSYLTQDEVRDLIDYCRERGISIIPEVPSTSHCDYLLTRHPELAERCEDPYPDTFCPSNPASYELLFDVLDEVIEVFRPEVINIGHDEYYTTNICDRCRKRIMTNYELYAEDVTKIHDYLASKGVKTMIWCDKLMNLLTEDGQNFGGALNYVYEEWDLSKELLSVIRPTWPARDLLSKDIICMNWSWGYGEEHDEEIARFPAVFGNFRGYDMTHFQRRCGKNVTGGMCSDWGATTPIYLQRNRIYITMAYNERLFWDETYDDTDEEQYCRALDLCFRQLFDYHYGTPVNREGRYVEILHTTQKQVPYHEFVDGIFTEGGEYERDYYLGAYRLHYADGTTQDRKIYLGEQIGWAGAEWYGKTVETGKSDATPGIRTSKLEPKIGEVAYSTLPVRESGKVFYKYLLENPCPEKRPVRVEFCPAEQANADVEICRMNIL